LLDKNFVDKLTSAAEVAEAQKRQTVSVIDIGYQSKFIEIASMADIGACSINKISCTPMTAAATFSIRD
jgi:hypothetical protein